MTSVPRRSLRGPAPRLTLQNLNTLFGYARLDKRFAEAVRTGPSALDSAHGWPLTVRRERHAGRNAQVPPPLRSPQGDWNRRPRPRLLAEESTLAKTSVLFTLDQALATLQAIAVAFAKAPQVTQPAASGVQTAPPTARSIGRARVEAIFV